MTKRSHLIYFEIAASFAKTLPALVLALACIGSVASAQSEPLIARVEMQLAIGDKIVDTIRKGDMLNVVEEREDVFVISTMSGARGALDKVNALKLAEAVEIYDELIRAEPKAGQLYTMRASAWWARGKTEEALSDFDQAIKLGYAEPHAFSSRGLFHAAMGNLNEAIADYSTAIKKAKEAKDDDESPYLNRAAVYITQKSFDKAIADYTAASELDPKNATIYQQRAVAHKQAADLKSAVADFTKAIELDPKNISAIMGRGYVWFQQQNHERAIEDFGAVIAIDSDSAGAYNNRGFNYKQLGQFDKALADYDKAIELSPEYALAHQNRGWLLATAVDSSVRDGKQAIISAKKACEINDYARISDLMTLAAALSEDGNFKEAIGWQEKVIDLAQGEQKTFAERVYAGYKQEKSFVEINKELSEDAS